MRILKTFKHSKRKSKQLKKSTDITVLILQMKNSKIYSSNDYALTKNMFIKGPRQFENNSFGSCFLHVLMIFINPIKTPAQVNRGGDTKCLTCRPSPPGVFC